MLIKEYILIQMKKSAKKFISFTSNYKYILLYNKTAAVASIHISVKVHMQNTKSKNKNTKNRKTLKKLQFSSYKERKNKKNRTNIDKSIKL